MTELEINEAVALKLGWVKNDDCEVYGGFLSSWKPKGGRFPPNFCQSIEAAWEIAEKYKLSVVYAHDQWMAGDLNPYTTDAGCVDGYMSHFAFADTAPRAICEAFLKLP